MESSTTRGTYEAEGKKRGENFLHTLFSRFRFIFKCLLECMIVHQMHAVPTEPEECIRCLRDHCERNVGAGN